MNAINTARFKVINWKEFAPAFVVAINSFIWYTLTYTQFYTYVNALTLESDPRILIFGIYYVGIAFAAIVGGIILPRFRIRGIILWMILGTFTSLLMVTIPSNTFIINVIISWFIGISIGLGLPSTLAYFADLARIDKRGLHGGITWVINGIGVLSLGIIITLPTINVGSEILALWRAIGVISFIFISRKTQEKSKGARKEESYKKVLLRKDLWLYLIPWIMFSVVNFIETPLVDRLLIQQFGDTAAYFIFFQIAITGIAALIGGILIDYIGRKRIVISGFVLSGIEYVILSLFGNYQFASYIFLSLDGIAWGFFAVVFFMTIWGDLAGENSKEKFYVIGGMPYLLAGFLIILIEPYIDSISTWLGMSFSIASFFLFIAVLPLIYAPETLPEKVIKDRNLKSYIEKAKKKAEHEAEKTLKKQEEKKKIKNETTEDTPEYDKNYEEAKKLAEKYY